MESFSGLNTELYHYGVLGMKWGVRRYENKDGTLTPEGKKRKKLKDLSDDELRQKINRLELEKKYRDLNKGPVSRAIGSINKMLNDHAERQAKKSKLIVAKAAMANTPLRKALASIPAHVADGVGKSIEKTLLEVGDLPIKAVKSAVNGASNYAKQKKQENKEKTEAARAKRGRDHTKKDE